MSLEFEDKDNGQQDPRSEALNRNTQRNQEAGAEVRGSRAGGAGMRGMGRSLGRAFGRSSTGEVLTKAMARFREPFESDTIVPDAPFQMKDHVLLPLDSSENRTLLSGVVVCLPIPDQQSGLLYVFAHTLLLEGSAHALPAFEEEHRGRRYNVPQVAGDVYNDRFISRVEALVESHWRDTKVKFVDCGAQVVYTEADIENNAAAVQDYTFYATAAVATTSVEVLKYQDAFTLDWLSPEKDRLEVSVDFSGEPVLNPAGLPRRTDVLLEMNASVQYEDGPGIEPLTKVGGALELVYSPSGDETSGSLFGRRRRDENTQIFRPVFAINTLDSTNKFITLEVLLLGLASTSILTEDAYWAEAFRPGLRHEPTKDVGAMSILTQAGVKFDTTSANLTDDDFLEYFGTLCAEKLAIALDVEERGETSWINEVFILAAEGDQGANDAIIDSADRLCGDLFSKRWDSNKPIVVDDENRIILGYVKESNGEIFDNREIDTMYMLNLRGHNDPDAALELQSTYDDLDLPANQRVVDRLRKLENYFGGIVKLKGFARRLVFNPEFIAALAAAIVESKVRIDRVSNANQLQRSRPRGNFRYERFAMEGVGRDLFRTRGMRRDDDHSSSGGSDRYRGRRDRW